MSCANGTTAPNQFRWQSLDDTPLLVFGFSPACRRSARGETSPGVHLSLHRCHEKMGFPSVSYLFVLLIKPNLSPSLYVLSPVFSVFLVGILPRRQRRRNVAAFRVSVVSETLPRRVHQLSDWLLGVSGWRAFPCLQ